MHACPGSLFRSSLFRTKQPGYSSYSAGVVQWRSASSICLRCILRGLNSVFRKVLVYWNSATCTATFARVWNELCLSHGLYFKASWSVTSLNRWHIRWYQKLFRAKAIAYAYLSDVEYFLPAYCAWCSLPLSSFCNNTAPITLFDASVATTSRFQRLYTRGPALWWVLPLSSRILLAYRRSTQTRPFLKSSLTIFFLSSRTRWWTVCSMPQDRGTVLILSRHG